MECEKRGKKIEMAELLMCELLRNQVCLMRGFMYLLTSECKRTNERRGVVADFNKRLLKSTDHVEKILNIIERKDEIRERETHSQKTDSSG
jgi:hypothetical protein